MSLKVFILLAGGAALLIHSIRSKTPLARTVNWSQDRVLLIGDSLAVGLAPKFKKLNQMIPGFQFHSVAKSGARIGAFNTNAAETGGGLAKVLAEFKPTVVLISLGTNDEAARKSRPAADIAAATRADTDALLTKLAGVHVIWIGPPLFAQNRWPMDAGFRQMLAEKVGAGNYFDSAAYPIPRARDGVHMTGAGYAEWAALVTRWINAKNTPTA